MVTHFKIGDRVEIREGTDYIITTPGSSGIIIGLNGGGAKISFDRIGREEALKKKRNFDIVFSALILIEAVKRIPYEDVILKIKILEKRFMERKTYV